MQTPGGPTPGGPTPGGFGDTDTGLESIHVANWSYWVQSQDGTFREPIDDLECIYIYIRQQ